MTAVFGSRAVNFRFRFGINIGKEDDSAAAKQILVESVGKQGRKPVRIY